MEESVKYLKKAVDLRSEAAALYLSNMFKNGIGVEKNEKKYLKYHNLAEELRDENFRSSYLNNINMATKAFPISNREHGIA